MARSAWSAHYAHALRAANIRALTATDTQRQAAVRAYHRASMHHLERYAPGPEGLDWENQPDPFRRYAGASIVALGHASAETGPSYVDALGDAPLPVAPVPIAPVDARAIAALFEDSLALSAWKSYGTSRWALRVNPSSGNLHPTEAYLLCGPIDGLCAHPSLFHYAPREHALELRAELPFSLWRALSGGLPASSIFVALASIHWREAWKYGMRAFRYCHHDAGHAIGAVGVAARALGWSVALCDDLATADLEELLGVRDPRGAEPEVPDVLLAIVPSATPPAHDALPHTLPEFALVLRGEPNVLSDDHVEWSAIEAAVEATRKPRTKRPFAGGQLPAASLSFPDAALVAAPLRRVVRARRSAVSFDGRTAISRASFYRMLSATCAGVARVLPWPPCVHFGVFVHRVDDLAPGVYVLARDERELPLLRAAMERPAEWTRADGAPEGLALHLLERGDARRMARQVSCHQEIAADGAFSLGMLARFDGALAEHGAWFYSRLYWECGLVGQILYLEAEAARVRATGIGCFFDSAVHRAFGLADARYQSLYHFTVGGPVDDPRLTTLPAYPAPSE